MTRLPETSQPLVPDARTPEDPVFPACQYCDAPADYRCEAPLGTSPVAFCRVPLCEVHENRAECLFSLLKPYLRVFRGVSKFNLPGYVGFFQFLRNFR